MRFKLQHLKLLARCLASIGCGLILISAMASCNQSQRPKNVVQKTFASPEDAGATLVEAAKTGDQSALLAIFGPDAKDVLSSGDPVKDKDTLQDFVAA